MKTSIHPVLASAALLLAAAAASFGTATTSVTIPIVSGTLASGVSVDLTSKTETIKPAHIYYYAISGTCHGDGFFATIVKPNTTLAAVFENVDPALVPYLTGFVLNPSGTLPFNCVNKLGSGSKEIGAQKVGAQARIDAGIMTNGVCFLDLTNILFTLNGATIPPTEGNIVIDKGQIKVLVFPYSGAARPNLGFVGGSTGHVEGIGVTGTSSAGHSESVNLFKTQSITYNVVLWNAGAVAGSFKLKSPAIGSGFTESFIYQGDDQTAAVTSAAGLRIPATGTLAGGSTATLSWKLSNSSAVAGAKINPVLSASLETTGTYKDALAVHVTYPAN